MENARVVAWEGTAPVAERDIQTWLAERGLQAMRWSNAPHDRYPSHSHPYPKIIFVLRGSIEFILTDRDERLLLNTGDRLELPSGIAHAAEVGDQGVVCLEAHL